MSEVERTVGVERPVGVILIAVLIWLEALLYLLAGIAILLSLGDEEFIGRFGGTVGGTAVGIITIVFAAVLFAVSGALLRGSKSARLLVTIVLIISLAGAIYTAIAVGGISLIGAIAGAAIPVIGLILLYTKKATTFFEA